MADGYIVNKHSDEIVKVEVVSESAQRVTIEVDSYWGKVRRRMNKVSSTERYFSTYEDARQYLCHRLRDHIEGYRQDLAAAERALRKLEDKPCTA